MLGILFLCGLFAIANGQSTPSLTEPKLISVVPLNSTALTVNWQFASNATDQSDLIVISIVIYEFYLTHNATYGPFTYSFTPGNKSITSLTRNFEWVSAYYYVCFSSNSTKSNTTQFVAVTNNCVFTRTCSRSNTSCPGLSSVQLTSTNVSATSFVVAFLWPIDLPYNRRGFSAQLANNGPSGTALAVTQNTSFYIYSYQFSNLQSSTSYVVNTSVTYDILNSATQTTVSTITVRTSGAAASKFVSIFYPVIAFLFFWQIK